MSSSSLWLALFTRWSRAMGNDKKSICINLLMSKIDCQTQCGYPSLISYCVLRWFIHRVMDTGESSWKFEEHKRSQSIFRSKVGTTLDWNNSKRDRESLSWAFVSEGDDSIWFGFLVFFNPFWGSKIHTVRKVKRAITITF